MKVICINSEAWPENFPLENDEGKIVNGETYEVTDVFFEEGYIWYEVSIDDGCITLDLQI